MTIIRVHYYSAVCEDFVHKDIELGLINFCATRQEVLEYMLNKAIEYCVAHGVEFNGFEIIAE